MSADQPPRWRSLGRLLWLLMLAVSVFVQLQVLRRRTASFDFGMIGQDFVSRRNREYQELKRFFPLNHGVVGYRSSFLLDGTVEAEFGTQRSYIQQGHREMNAGEGDQKKRSEARRFLQRMRIAQYSFAPLVLDRGPAFASDDSQSSDVDLLIIDRLDNPDQPYTVDTSEYVPRAQLESGLLVLEKRVH